MGDKTVLERVDAALAGIAGDQKELSARIKELEKGGVDNEIEARLKAVDDGLKTTQDTLAEVERDLNAQRHTGGVDHLRNALPDYLKAWVPFVANMNGHSGVLLDDAGGALERSPAILKWAHKDPIAFTACGGWFQARLKQSLAGQSGDQKTASLWCERAESLEKMLGGFHPFQKATMDEGTAATGGHLVPTILEAVIGFIVKDASMVRKAGATILTMTSNKHDLPNKNADFTVQWPAESAAFTDGAPASPFGKPQLEAVKQGAIAIVTLELIQDNVVNLMDYILQQMLEAAGRAEDVQALEGVGSPFTGLIGVSGVADVSSAVPASLVMNDLIRVIYGQEEVATFEGRTVLWCHPWIVRDSLELTTGAAGTPWLPFLNNSNAKPGDLLVPTFPTTSISRTGGAGAETNLYHGNPRGLVIGDRMGSTFDVNPWARTEYTQGEVLLRLMRRVGVVTWIPGYFSKCSDINVTAI